MECVIREIPKLESEQELIKIKGFCINRADILETKGLYKSDI